MDEKDEDALFKFAANYPDLFKQFENQFEKYDTTLYRLLTNNPERTEEINQLRLDIEDFTFTKFPSILSGHDIIFTNVHFNLEQDIELIAGSGLLFFRNVKNLPYIDNFDTKWALVFANTSNIRIRNVLCDQRAEFKYGENIQVEELFANYDISIKEINNSKFARIENTDELIILSCDNIEILSGNPTRLEIQKLLNSKLRFDTVYFLNIIYSKSIKLKIDIFIGVRIEINKSSDIELDINKMTIEQLGIVSCRNIRLPKEINGETLIIADSSNIIIPEKIEIDTLRIHSSEVKLPKNIEVRRGITISDSPSITLDDIPEHLHSITTIS